MGIYTCAVCGYEYITEDGDIENGVPEGTEFEDISQEWSCPVCGASKEDFELVENTDE